jgi:predicted esterase
LTVRVAIAAVCLATATPASQEATRQSLTRDDAAVLEDVSQRAFQFFWNEADPTTGIVRDRARTDGAAHDGKNRDVGSIAAVGFGLSGLCIAADRGWVSRPQALERARNTLRFFAERSPHERGWFFHFVNIRTGMREWQSELSSIDTALLLAGVLTARRCFETDAEVVRFADAIYRRVDFSWMLNGHPHVLSMGWRPESGFIDARWNHYCELMVLYLLAIGSPTHPIPAESWQAWRRPTMGFGDFEYVSWQDPLFVHQYSHAWIDFRGRRERQAPHIDWWQNSIEATYAHKTFCLSLSSEYPGYTEHIWGFTASDSAKGYVAWHGPPRHERIDGSVVPAAAAGSLMLTPEIALPAVREMRRRFGDRVYGKYGFADAFNPTTGWVNPDVIGIDVGITLLSAENLRTGRIWSWFMANPEVTTALDRVGLEPLRQAQGVPGPRRLTGRTNNLTHTAPVASPGLQHYEFVVPERSAERDRYQTVIAQTTTIPADTFEARMFTSPQGIVLGYRLLRPSGANSNTKVPMVVVFHGAGEIGTDNEKQMTAFAKLWARDDIRREFPAFVVVPQFPSRSAIYSGPVTQGGRTTVAAAPIHAALALVDELRGTLPVDASRIYLTGFSMGASSTWNALHLRPDLFAAAVPIAGVANRAFAPHVAATPVWVLHGNRDETNALNHERVMFDALSQCAGAAIVFWEHDGLGHEVPPSILAGSQLPRWLFSHRRAAGQSAPRPCL